MAALNSSLRTSGSPLLSQFTPTAPLAGLALEIARQQLCVLTVGFHPLPHPLSIVREAVRIDQINRMPAGMGSLCNGLVIAVGGRGLWVPEGDRTPWLKEGGKASKPLTT